MNDTLSINSREYLGILKKPSIVICLDGSQKEYLDEASKLNLTPNLDKIIKKGEYLYKDFQRGVNSTLTAILGRMATYSGQKISWDEALSSNIDIVPKNLTSFEDTAPVYPDKNGKYPIPIPGKTKFI